MRPVDPGRFSRRLQCGPTDRTDGPGRDTQAWLAGSIATDLGLLGFFKYTNFLLVNAGWAGRLAGFDTSGWRLDIILPVGISFFTFKSLSYTVDVYRRKIQPCTDVRDYLLFVSFFPQLLAGPIARAGELLPQLTQRARATSVETESGLAQIGLGVFKKLVIADQVAIHVDLIFANPGQYDALTLLQGAIGYAVQIYCDFSGYSDIAIGAARIMGYRTAENFQMPYSAADITDFWRRWHISLTSWFRDYLFLPMAYGLSRRMPEERYGGVRVDVIIYLAGILATFSVCGLWHGASWTFVLWGTLHGIGLALHRGWKLLRPLRRFPRSRLVRPVSTVFAHVATLALVQVGWILFRSDTVRGAWEYLSRIGAWESTGTRMLSPYILPAGVASTRSSCADREGPELGFGDPAPNGGRARSGVCIHDPLDCLAGRERCGAFHLPPVLTSRRSISRRGGLLPRLLQGVQAGSADPARGIPPSRANAAG